VEPQGEACVVAVMAMCLWDRADAAALSSALLAMGNQEESLHAVYLGWYTCSKIITEKVNQAIAEAREAHPSLRLQAKKIQMAEECNTTLQGLQLILPSMPELPAHSWVTFPQLDGFWSPRNASSLLPALRRAAADQRVVALCSKRFARPKGQERRLALEMPMQVEAALSSGAAEHCQVTEPSLADVAVRLKTLQAFLEATPASVLRHDLCVHRFMYRLRNTFGKKVQDFNPPDGEWMRWYCPPPERKYKLPLVGTDDYQLGDDLLAGFSQARREEDEQERSAAEEGAVSGRPALPFNDAEEAAEAISELRKQIEKALVLSAGDKMSAKDLRSIATGPALARQRSRTRAGPAWRSLSGPGPA